MNSYKNDIKKEEILDKAHNLTSNVGSKTLTIDLSELIKNNNNNADDHNNVYSQELLIQNRVLNNLGVQKDLLSNCESENTVILENKFDYKDFIVKNPDFFLKKESIEKVEQSSILIDNNNTSELLSKPKKLTENFIKYLITRFPYTIMVTALIYGVQALNAHYQDQTQSYYTIGIASHLIGQTKELYANSKNYSQVSDQMLIKAKAVDYSLVSNNKLLNNYGGNYKVYPATTTSLNDTIAVDIDKVPSEKCEKLVMALQYLTVTQVKVNNTTLLKNGFIDLENVGKVCSLKQNTVTVLDNDNKTI